MWELNGCWLGTAGGQLNRGSGTGLGLLGDAENCVTKGMGEKLKAASGESFIVYFIVWNHRPQLKLKPALG